MDFLKSLLEPGTIVGIIGAAIGLWGLWSAYKAKRTQVLEYEITSTQILTNGANNIPGLQIVVGDEFASSNLTSSEIEFCNRGNTTIHQRDFPSKAKLRIITSGRFFNIETINKDLIKSSNPALNPDIDIINDETLEISFEYLKPKEKFSLSVLHDGEICVKGDLKSGKIRQQQDAPSEEISPKRNAGRSRSASLYMNMMTIIIALSIVAVISTYLFSRFSDEWLSGSHMTPQMEFVQLENDQLKLKMETIQHENDQLKLKTETIQSENDRLLQENYELKDEIMRLREQIYEMRYYIEGAK